METSQTKQTTNTPKILVGVITYEGEKYCREVFFSYLKNLSMPHLSFVFVTNSGEDDAKDLRERAKQLQGTSAVFVSEKKEHVLDQIVVNRNIAREYFLASDCEYLYFIDSDVIGPKNAIEVLLSHNKKLTTGWYFATFNYNGKPRLLPVAYAFDKPGTVRQMKPQDVLVPRFGKIATAGLGCALIHKSLFKDISFRRANGTEDSMFYQDVREKYNEDLWLDTRVGYWHLKFPPGDQRNNPYDPRRYALKK